MIKVLSSAALIATAALSGTVMAQGAMAQGQTGPALAGPQWKLRTEQGSCLAEKGAPNGPRIQMTSRGRMLLSSPDLPDPWFEPGEPADIELHWSDGTVEQLAAATLTLPGGGAQNLKPRKVYVVPYTTTGLEERFPEGFTLTVYRYGQLMLSIDGRDAGPFLETFNDCAATIFAKSQQPATPQ